LAAASTSAVTLTALTIGLGAGPVASGAGLPVSAAAAAGFFADFFDLDMVSLLNFYFERECRGGVPRAVEIA
jgi:hypothetical protein